MEAAICGFKAISLSYAFNSRNHDPKIIGAASTLSVKLIEHLYNNWGGDVDLYSINVPLVEGVEKNKIEYTEMLHNLWSSGSCFESVSPDEGDQDPDKREKEIRQNQEQNGQVESKTHARFAHRHFKWAPRFSDVYESVVKAGPGTLIAETLLKILIYILGNDGWAVKEGYTR